MTKHKWVVPRIAKTVDPRIAIARHIGWIKPITNETEFSLPEPDHYNYAGMANQAHDCPFIADQVFYRDLKANKWWSVYYVPQELVDAFITWAEPIQYDHCWTPHRSTRMRTRRGLLHAKKHSIEQTLPERLFTMGYYDELQKEFNIDISDNLGKPRDNIPQGEFL